MSQPVNAPPKNDTSQQYVPTHRTPSEIVLLRTRPVTQAPVQNNASVQQQQPTVKMPNAAVSAILMFNSRQPAGKHARDKQFGSA